LPNAGLISPKLITLRRWYRNPGVITIEFVSGLQRRIKADKAKLEDGVLVLYVYTPDRRMLLSTGSFPVETIKWARLDNGTVLIGDPQQ